MTTAAIAFIAARGRLIDRSAHARNDRRADYGFFAAGPLTAAHAERIARWEADEAIAPDWARGLFGFSAPCAGVARVAYNEAGDTAWLIHNGER